MIDDVNKISKGDFTDSKPNIKNQNIYPSESPEGEMLIYQTDDGRVRLDVRLENETIWLTQQMIAELFQTSVPNISMHIKNIYDERELSTDGTIKDFLTVRREGTRGVQRKLTYYNLDMIISVGYRVKSLIATRFRIWATQRLKEYLIKGFVMDDERSRNGYYSEKRVNTGYSSCNLWNMEHLYLAYADEAIWRQAVAKLPRGAKTC